MLQLTIHPLEINECIDSKYASKCHGKMQCLNTVGSFKCVCVPGYVNVADSKKKSPTCTGMLNVQLIKSELY